MWIDATVVTCFLTNSDDSRIADKTGFTLPPDNGSGKRINWLWAPSLEIPAETQKAVSDKKFIDWAMFKDYLERVARKES